MSEITREDMLECLESVEGDIFPPVYKAIRSLIESSGEKDATQFVHPDGEIDWAKPAPSPAPLPSEVEEAMEIIDGLVLTDGVRKDPAAWEVIKAALSQSTPVCREKDDIPCPTIKVKP